MVLSCTFQYSVTPAGNLQIVQSSLMEHKKKTKEEARFH
jgi:hypothetical protein